MADDDLQQTYEFEYQNQALNLSILQPTEHQSIIDHRHITQHEMTTKDQNMNSNPSKLDQGQTKPDQ